METDREEVDMDSKDCNVKIVEEKCDSVDGTCPIVEGSGSSTNTVVEISKIVDMENDSEKIDVDKDTGKSEEENSSKDTPDTCEIEDADIVEFENDGRSVSNENVDNVDENPSASVTSARSSEDDLAEVNDSDFQEIDMTDIVEIGNVEPDVKCKSTEEVSDDVKDSHVETDGDCKTDVEIGVEKKENTVAEVNDEGNDVKEVGDAIDSDVQEIDMADIVEVDDERQSECENDVDPEAKGNSSDEDVMNIDSEDERLFGIDQEVDESEAKKGDVADCDGGTHSEDGVAQASDPELPQHESVNISDIMEGEQNKGCVEVVDDQGNNAEGNVAVSDAELKSKDNAEEGSGSKSPNSVVGRVEIIEISDGEDDSVDVGSETDTSCTDDEEDGESESDSDDESEYGIDLTSDVDEQEGETGEMAAQEVKKTEKERDLVRTIMDKNLIDKFLQTSGVQLKTLQVRLNRVKVPAHIKRRAQNWGVQSEPVKNTKIHLAKPGRKPRGKSTKPLECGIHRPIFPSELSSLYLRNKDLRDNRTLTEMKVNEGSEPGKVVFQFGTRVRRKLEESRSRRLLLADKGLMKSVLVDFEEDKHAMQDNRPFKVRFPVKDDKPGSADDDDSVKWPDEVEQMSDDSGDIDESELVDPVTGEYKHAPIGDDTEKAVEEGIITVDVDEQDGDLVNNPGAIPQEMMTLGNRSSQERVKSAGGSDAHHGAQQEKDFNSSDDLTSVSTSVETEVETDGRSPEAVKQMERDSSVAARIHEEVVEPVAGTSEVESTPANDKPNTDTAGGENTHTTKQQSKNMKNRLEIFAKLKKEVVKNLSLALRLKNCEISETRQFIHENGLEEYLSVKCISMMKSMIMFGMERSILAALNELPIRCSDADDTEHMLLTITDQVLFKLCQILYIWKRLPVRKNCDGSTVDLLDMVGEDVEEMYVVTDQITLAEWRKDQQQIQEMADKEAKWLAEVNQRERVISRQERSDLKDWEKDTPPLPEKGPMPVRTVVELFDKETMSRFPQKTQARKKFSRSDKPSEVYMDQDLQESEEIETNKATGKDKEEIVTNKDIGKDSGELETIKETGKDAEQLNTCKDTGKDTEELEANKDTGTDTEEQETITETGKAQGKQSPRMTFNHSRKIPSYTKGRIDFEQLAQREELRLQKMNLKEKAISLRKRLVEEMDKAEMGTEYTPSNDDPSLSAGMTIPTVTQSEESIICVQSVKQEWDDIPDDADKIAESHGTVVAQKDVQDEIPDGAVGVNLRQEPLSHYAVETDQGPVPQFLYKVIKDKEETTPPWPVGTPYTDAEMQLRQSTANDGKAITDGSAHKDNPDVVSGNLTNETGPSELAGTASSNRPVTFVNATSDAMLLIPHSFMKDQSEQDEQQSKSQQNTTNRKRRGPRKENKKTPKYRRCQAPVTAREAAPPLVSPTTPTLVGPFTAAEINERFQTQLGTDLLNSAINNPAQSAQSQSVLNDGGGSNVALVLAGDETSAEALQLTPLQQLLQRSANTALPLLPTAGKGKSPVKTDTLKRLIQIPVDNTLSPSASQNPTDTTFPFTLPPGLPQGKPVLINSLNMAGTTVHQYVIVPQSHAPGVSELQQAQEAATTGATIVTYMNGKLFQMHTASGEILPLPEQTEPQPGPSRSQSGQAKTLIGQPQPHSGQPQLHSGQPQPHSAQIQLTGQPQPHSAQIQLTGQPQPHSAQIQLTGQPQPHSAQAQLSSQTVPHSAQTVPYSEQTQNIPLNTPPETLGPLYKIVDCQLVQCSPQDLTPDKVKGRVYRVVNGQVVQVQPEELQGRLTQSNSGQVASQAALRDSGQISSQAELVQPYSEHISLHGMTVAYSRQASSQAGLLVVQSCSEQIPSQGMTVAYSGQIPSQAGLTQSYSGQVPSQGGLSQVYSGQVSSQGVLTPSYSGLLSGLAGQVQSPASYSGQIQSQAGPIACGSYSGLIPSHAGLTQSYSGPILSQGGPSSALLGTELAQNTTTSSVAFSGPIPAQVLQSQPVVAQIVPDKNLYQQFNITDVAYSGPTQSQVLPSQPVLAQTVPDKNLYQQFNITDVANSGPTQSQVLPSQPVVAPTVPNKNLYQQFNLTDVANSGPTQSQVLPSQPVVAQTIPDKNLYQQFNLTSDGRLQQLVDPPVSQPAVGSPSTPAVTEPDYSQELHPKILNVFSLWDKTTPKARPKARPDVAKRPELDLFGRVDHTDACQSEKWCVLSWRDVKTGLATYFRETKRSSKPSELVEFSYLLRQTLRREEIVPMRQDGEKAGSAEDTAIPGELKPGKNYDYEFIDRMMIGTIVDALRILQLGITVEGVRLLCHMFRQISKVKPWVISIDNLIHVLSFVHKEAEKSNCPSNWTEPETPMGDTLWICRVCGRRLRKGGTFKKHAEVHAKYYAIKQRELETEHVYNHCNTSFCIFCKKVFASADAFYGHFTWPCSKDQMLTLPLMKTTDALWKRDDRQFVKPQKEIAEDSIRLSLDVVVFKASIKALQTAPYCAVCGKSCESLEQLRVHLSWHATQEDIRLVCTKCNINFQCNDIEFFDHVELHDAGDFNQLHACEVCKIGFLFKHSIHVHYKKSHVGISLPSNLANYHPYRPDERVKGHVMALNNKVDSGQGIERGMEQAVSASGSQASDSNATTSLPSSDLAIPINPQINPAQPVGSAALEKAGASSVTGTSISRIPEHEEGILSGRTAAVLGRAKIGPAKHGGSAAIESDLEKARASSIAKRKADLEKKKQALMAELNQRKERLVMSGCEMQHVTSSDAVHHVTSSGVVQHVPCPNQTVTLNISSRAVNDGGQATGVGSSQGASGQSPELLEEDEEAFIEIDSSESDTDSESAEETAEDADGSWYKVIPDSMDLSQIGSFDEVMVGIVNVEGKEMSVASPSTDRSSRESSTVSVEHDRRRTLQAEAEASCMATDNLEMQLKSLGVEMVSCDSSETSGKTSYKLKTNIKGCVASASTSKVKSQPNRHGRTYSAAEVLKNPDSFEDLTHVTVELKRLSQQIPYFT